MIFDINQLLDADIYDHDVEKFGLIETHISWVILTGRYAYKIKKPVDFGFLDFSTLEKRHQYCQREVELNRRLAPDIYLSVIAVTRQGDRLSLNGSGEIIEYAVKMRQFPQSAQLDHQLDNGLLTSVQMDSIAVMIANFHQTVEVADRNLSFGTAEAVYRPVQENFDQIRLHLAEDRYQHRLDQLEAWSRKAHAGLIDVFNRRKANGFVRHCHGDMHLRNMIWLDVGGIDQSETMAGPMAFDCIEFNPEFSWIDVISEVAFLVMDLQSRGQPELANRFINAYLEQTGDYDGIAVLNFYLCYRAMVRAKVAALRLEQETDTNEKRATIKEFESYLSLASGYMQENRPCLFIMHGLSASGKSTVSQQIVEAMGAFRIRSDVERKRLLVKPGQDSRTTINEGIYSSAASEFTYRHLLALARGIIESGYSVVVDAAFLKPEQRQPFQSMANQLAVIYRIINVTAPFDVLRERIRARANDVSDADLDVLEHQIAHYQPLDKTELDSCITIDSQQAYDREQLAQRIRTNM